MHLLLRGFAVLATAGLLTGASLGVVAAQQRTDSIEYQPDPDSATPRSFGVANITYYTSTSPTRVLAEWHFWDLDDGHSYFIVLNGQGDGGTPFRGTCAFQPLPGGEGTCTAHFSGMTSVVDSNVYQDGEGGPIALRMR